jgi:hypothetical protein
MAAPPKRRFQGSLAVMILLRNEAMAQTKPEAYLREFTETGKVF